jgi:hypothetical protein
MTEAVENKVRSVREDWPPKPVLPEGMKIFRKFPDYLAPLTDPLWVPASQAAHMAPDDPVIAVLAGEQSYALPWWVMKNHHAGNLTLGDRRVVVTLCERCSSAAAFDARVGGDARTFQVIGSYQGTHVIGDYETHSVWASFTGRCLLGPAEGERLGRLPAFQASWAEWSARFPDTLVADGAGEPRDGHGFDRRPGTDEGPLGGYELEDHRLPSAELVLGVEAGGRSTAYPLAALTDAGGVVNDDLGGAAVVVLSSAESWIAMAFHATVDGVRLEFDAAGPGARDRSTGSDWDLTGRAVAGPLAGTRLEFGDSLVEEWHAWAAYHPQTDIFGADGR